MELPLPILMLVGKIGSIELNNNIKKRRRAKGCRFGAFDKLSPLIMSRNVVEDNEQLLPNLVGYALIFTNIEDLVPFQFFTAEKLSHKLYCYKGLSCSSDALNP